MSEAAQSLPSNPLILESRHDGVATLTLNRPDKLNAINKDLAIALNESLARITTDKSVFVVVITGAGRAFCAGGDLGLIGEGRKNNDITELEPLLRAGMHAVLKIRSMAQPVIAAVNGPAAGAGMNIALAADIRIASENCHLRPEFRQSRIVSRLRRHIFPSPACGPRESRGNVLYRRHD